MINCVLRYTRYEVMVQYPGWVQASLCCRLVFWDKFQSKHIIVFVPCFRILATLLLILTGQYLHFEFWMSVLTEFYQSHCKVVPSTSSTSWQTFRCYSQASPVLILLLSVYQKSACNRGAVYRCSYSRLWILKSTHYLQADWDWDLLGDCTLYAFCERQKAADTDTDEDANADTDEDVGVTVNADANLGTGK